MRSYWSLSSSPMTADVSFTSTSRSPDCRMDRTANGVTFACRRSSSHSHRGPSGPPQSLDQSQARASKTNAFDASTGNRPIRVQPSSAVAECSDIASCLWRAESLTCAWRIAILQAFFEVWIPKTPRTEPTKSQQFLNGNTSWRRFLVPMLD